MTELIELMVISFLQKLMQQMQNVFPGRCGLMHRPAFEIASYLLEQGADPNAPDDKGDTPMHTAVTYQNTEGVLLLLAQTACPNRPNKKGQTPTMLAMSRHSEAYPGSIAVLGLLLQRGGILLD